MCSVVSSAVQKVLQNIILPSMNMMKPTLCCISDTFFESNTAALASLAMIGHFLQKLLIRRESMKN